MSPQAFAWRQAQPYQRILAGGAVLRVMFRLLPLQVPIVAGWMITALGSGAATASPDTLNRNGLLLMVFAILTGLTAYGSARLRKNVEEHVSHALQEEAWTAWQTAPPSFRADFGADRFASQILSYCSAAADLAGTCTIDGLAAACRMAYPVAMLLYLDPWLALVPLGLLPLQAILAHLATQHGQQHAKSEREARREAKTLFQQSLTGVDTLQALGATQHMTQWIANSQRRFEDLKDTKRKYERQLSSGVWGLAAMGLALTWWAGSHRVASGQISIGHLVTFVGFVGFLALPLRSFAGLARKVRNSLDRLDHVKDFLSAAQAARDQVKALSPGLAPDVALRLSDVHYSAGPKTILNGASITFPRGELVWIRGRSGSGKSSLLQLLAGLESPQQGEIYASSRPILWVPQDVAVFPVTVRDNLRMGFATATEEQMWLALSQAGLSECIRELDHGLDSHLGSSLRLSLGDKQKLVIARALLSQPAVLLLDEVTNSLDEEDELHLLEELARLKKNITILLVAHQVRSLSGIDRVVELRDGQLQEWATQYKDQPEERN